MGVSFRPQSNQSFWSNVVNFMIRRVESGPIIKIKGVIRKGIEPAMPDLDPITPCYVAPLNKMLYL